MTINWQMDKQNVYSDYRTLSSHKKEISTDTCTMNALCERKAVYVMILFLSNV